MADESIAAPGTGDGEDDEAEEGINPFGFLVRILPYFGPYRRFGGLFLAGLIVEIAFEQVLLPLAFKTLVDEVIIERNGPLLIVILGVLLGGAILHSGAAIGRDYLVAYLGERVLNDMRIRLFEHLQRLPVGFYSKTQLADIMARFSTDLASIDDVMFQGLPSGSRAVLAFFVNTSLLFALDWRLSLIAMLALPLSFVGPWRIGARSSALTYATKQAQAQISSRVQESVQAQALVKAFGMQGTMVDQFRAYLAGYFGLAVRAHYYAFLMERTPNLGMLVFKLLVIAGGAVLAFQGHITIGALVAASQIAIGLSQSVDALTWSVPDMVGAGAGLRRIEEILEAEPEPAETSDTAPLTPLRDAVEFHDVTFGYTAERSSLRDVTLRIPRGGYVAFVGESGSGKSTILNLIARFYDPQQGRVTFDGIDLRRASAASLRAQMGMVFQDNFLFGGTFKDNLRLVKPDATDAEIEAACRAAEIHDLITSLPRGYDTPVGEAGGWLSGGQRQRVAIARALLRDPQVLILDEATSALDPGTEQAINETLARIARGRTVMTVTHRLASVTRADLIYVLQAGVVVESGRHEDLLARGGVYRRLWDKQNGFTVSPDGGHATVDPDRLKVIPLLEQLDGTVLADLAHYFQTEQVPAGRAVVEEGAPGDRFYIIVRGKVAVEKAIEGAAQVVAVLSDGDYFGEIALLRNAPRNATVRAQVDSVLLSLPRDPFLHLIEHQAALRDRIEQAMADRLNPPSPIESVAD